MSERTPQGGKQSKGYRQVENRERKQTERFVCGKYVAEGQRRNCMCGKAETEGWRRKARVDGAERTSSSERSQVDEVKRTRRVVDVEAGEI